MVAVIVPAGLALTQVVGSGILGTALAPRGARSPQVAPGLIGEAARAIVALSERGLDPVISTDPFTGDTVVSTADQARHLQGILEDKAARELLAPFPEEIAQIRELRDIVIEAGRRVNTSDIRLQGQVSATPVSTRATARLIAPGVVGRGNRSSEQAISRRASGLSGPCAGPQSGFSRLRCAQGAFT